MNFLAFLGDRDGMSIQIWTHQAIAVSPIMTGFFAAAFWTALTMSLASAGPPALPYSLLAVYSVLATLVNAYLVRVRGMALSPSLGYTTGLFAGAAIAIQLAYHVDRALGAPHRIRRPAGGALVVGIPLLLAPLPYAASWPPVGLLLIGSAALGLWTLLFLINTGFSSAATTRAEPMILSGIFFVLPEYLGLSIAPAVLRFLGIPA